MSASTTITRVAAGITLAVLAAACRSDRASVLEPFGEPSFDFPISQQAAGLPGGSVVAARPATGSGTVTVTLSNLEPLVSGVYKVWIGEENATDSSIANVMAAAGSITITTTDTAPGGAITTSQSFASGSSFSTGGANVSVSLVVNATTLGSDPTTAGRNVVYVSLESSDAATIASDAKPLFARYTQPAAAGSRTTALTFGKYSPIPSQRYTYVPTGRGRGGVRGTVLVSDDSALTRPPVGYYYAGFLIARDSLGTPTDTIPLGPLTAPPPRRSISLRDADIAFPDVVVVNRPPSITAASLRFDAGVSGDPTPFSGFTELVITLQNKFGAETVKAPNQVLKGTLPSIVTTPE